MMKINEDEAKKFVQSLMLQYANRSAMKEEFQKLGILYINQQ
jgi:polyhydroxyalkanoate synthesis regulator phasin